jgi:L-threonylcarbamoyladenylate synthase
MKDKTKQAVKILKEGGIIVYPTEGVYGLGCDPFNETAVLRLLKIKKRSVGKGLILIAASWDQIAGLIKVKLKKSDIAKMEKGEPTTWIFPASNKAPKWVIGKFKTIAIRVTSHKLTKKICKQFGGPIVSTSANLEAQSPAISFSQLRKEVVVNADFIIKGRTGGLKKPTKICGFVNKEIVRS